MSDCSTEAFKPKRSDLSAQRRCGDCLRFIAAKDPEDHTGICLVAQDGIRDDSSFADRCSLYLSGEE